MACFGNTKMVSVAVVLVVVMTVILSAEGQEIPSCANGLVPCLDYLNATTKPPPSCCDPLKQAVSKQLPCLCNLYNTPGLLKSFGINVTQAIKLPTLCGVPGDLCQGGSSCGAVATGTSCVTSCEAAATGTSCVTSCGAVASGGKNTSSPAGPTTGPRKANDSSSTSSTPTPKSDAGRLASTGIFSCVLIWASLFLH